MLAGELPGVNSTNDQKHVLAEVSQQAVYDSEKEAFWLFGSAGAIWTIYLPKANSHELEKETPFPNTNLEVLT